MASELTLANCEDEPIHVPGAVQPHGALLVLDAGSLVVLEASESLETLCDVSAGRVLGTVATALFDAPSRDRLKAAAAATDLRLVNPLRLTLATRDQAFDAVLHRPLVPAGSIVLELEPAPNQEAHAAGFDPRLREALLTLQVANDRAALAQAAAEQVRALTGFDRVMVYRFDRDWNGQVIAEARAEHLDSFLHQRYPASDIPAQARQLYKLNWLRLIADVAYVPSPMVGRPGAPPLDMSFATLRSVSPIHVEYLRNMGVAASMSISLLTDGELDGLIACHHYAGPLRVPFVIRETCAYLGQALSWQTTALRTAYAAERAKHVRESEAAIMVSVARESDLLDGLATEALTGIAEAAGAVLVLQEGSRRVGVTPSTEQLTKLVAYLGTREEDTFFTDKLSRELPEAAGWMDVASGVLAVTISRELREYLIWFRPMTEQTLDWAGNPHHEKLTKGTGEASRLTPRGSFALWREIVRGQSLPWEPWHVQAASNLRRLLLGGIRRRSVELRALNNRLLDADRAKNDFIATVSHELRTPLNAIGGWATMLERGTLPPERMTKAFSVITRNVENQRLLIEDLLDVSRMSTGKLTLDVSTVDFSLVIETAVQSVVLSAEAKQIRIQTALDDMDVVVLGDPLRLRQIVSNLLTNAVKFTPAGGSVTVSLVHDGDDVELHVTDTGIGINAEFLPHVFDLFRQEDASMNRRSQGLGLGLAIVKKLVELHGGRVWAESDGVGAGSSFRVRLPQQAVEHAAGHVEESEHEPSSFPAGALAGLHVLVLEDEADSRDLIQHILEQAGARVTPVANAEEALDVLASGLHAFDLVLSDIGLPVIDGMHFMRTVRERGPTGGGSLPAVALTAHTRAVDRTRVLQAGFNAHVPKPVDPEELLAVLTSVLLRRQ